MGVGNPPCHHMGGYGLGQHVSSVAYTLSSMEDHRYHTILYINISLAAAVIVLIISAFNVYLHYKMKNTLVEKLSEIKTVQSVEAGENTKRAGINVPKTEPIYIHMDERPRCLSLSAPKVKPNLYQNGSLQRGIRSGNLNNW